MPRNRPATALIDRRHRTPGRAAPPALDRYRRGAGGFAAGLAVGVAWSLWTVRRRPAPPAPGTPAGHAAGTG